MASDFHTHEINSAGAALISTSHPLPGKLTSWEYHPWNLPENYDRQIISQAGDLSSFAAIGEIGLDRLKGTALPVQQKFLNDLLALADDMNKPVVIHCVRAVPELLSALKPYKLRVMFHGFRSSPELLDELWKHDITVSFHPAALKKEYLMEKFRSPAGKFGFESDDTSIPVAETIKNAAHATGVAAEILEKITDQNFRDFLEI
jgi:TatD DNase family protein